MKLLIYYVEKENSLRRLKQCSQSTCYVILKQIQYLTQVKTPSQKLSSTVLSLVMPHHTFTSTDLGCDTPRSTRVFGNLIFCRMIRSSFKLNIDTLENNIFSVVLFTLFCNGYICPHIFLKSMVFCFSRFCGLPRLTY